ncbi:unnamed protein product [Parascedosporium putredinis]|uniref:Uncharacterized protein n=1 Tax=Parascedosporium putredinis TaxID=1442378 RepID=A0A9P1H5E3_9PEZI|nr:unnamed protein product [Parascedosporium putredinis]CAI7997852.1 unnamed protein product [Parascedosporium putredinis]
MDCHELLRLHSLRAHTADCLYSRFLASGALAVFGLFTLLFAGDKSRRSKKHGFDKDTSSFPFTNNESYRAKKKKVKGI